MTKIIFLQYAIFEHLGTEYLSAILKKGGHKCNLFIYGLEKNILNTVLNEKPDIVAISCITGIHKWALCVAEEIKKRSNIIILLGGPHATFFPEIINDKNVDVVCRGESEYTLLELADKLRDKKDITKIKNLWVKKNKRIYRNEMRNLISDLDNLPFPDRQLYYNKYKSMKNDPRKTFITTRGCPYSCSFCFNYTMKKLYENKGKYVRRRSAKNIINEMKEVREEYGMKSVYIADDTFILDKKWLFNFLSLYRKEVGLPFFCLIRANLVDNEVIKQLSLAGCHSVAFGIESGNEELRNKILHKNLTYEQIINTAKLLKKYKIKMRTYNMVGLPKETLDKAFETVKINTSIKVDYPWCSIFQPYPGTRINEYITKEGLLNKNFTYNDINESFFSSSPLINKEKKELVNLQKLFFYAVKFPKLNFLIKKLIKLPKNFLFDLAFLLSYFYIYKGSEKVSFLRAFKYGLDNIKSFFNKNEF